MTELAVALLRSHAEPFLGVYLRVFGIFVMTPVLGGFEVPTIVRGQISFLIALVAYPVAAAHLPPVPADVAALVLRYVGEFAIGLLIGLVVLLLFSAFQLAGEFYSMQMGFGISNVIDPLSQSSVPILGSFKSLFALALFLLSDGHHAVIVAVVRSFERLPGLDVAAAGAIHEALLAAFSASFVAGLRLAAPMVAVIFLVELVMGILSKAAPQMNIMVVGFQIKIAVGLLALVALWPVLWKVGGDVFDVGFRGVEGMIRAAATGA